MDEIAQKSIDIASRIKATDPQAIVCGPEEGGWAGYLYSGYDQQYAAAHAWSSFPDKVAHSGADYVPWLVAQLRARNLLDVLTLHFYPQSGEFSDDVSPAMQQLRNRSTRSLWDPNYRDESWIDDVVMLIPRMRSWSGGLKIGITEYNWGAEHHINGATTQADILGIFGREALDLAARWTTPDRGTPVYEAIKLFRNYDDRKSGFGDVSVSAGGPNPDDVSCFAAIRSSDGALTVMIVNKVTTDTTATIDIANFTPSSTAQRWQLTSSNAIARVADTGTTLTLPAQSVTLLVFPARATSHHRAAHH